MPSRIQTARSRACCAALLVAIAGGAAFPSPAAADGDPASDVLFADDVFATFQLPTDDAGVAALVADVERARLALPVKVAVVHDARDLGAVPVLFGKPMTYARFLGAEISLRFTGVLVVVMPQGVAVVPVPARSPTAREQAAAARSRLDARPVPTGEDADPKHLVAAARRAVDVVTARSGPTPHPPATVGAAPDDDRSPWARHPRAALSLLGALLLLAALLGSWERGQNRRP